MSAVGPGTGGSVERARAGPCERAVSEVYTHIQRMESYRYIRETTLPYTAHICLLKEETREKTDLANSKRREELQNPTDRDRMRFSPGATSRPELEQASKGRKSDCSQSRSCDRSFDVLACRSRSTIEGSTITS